MTFEDWWTIQCLKIATGVKIYFAKSVYHGDQKIAFDAGYAAGKERAVKIANNYCGGYCPPEPAGMIPHNIAEAIRRDGE